MSTYSTSGALCPGTGRFMNTIGGRGYCPCCSAYVEVWSGGIVAHFTSRVRP